MLHPKVVTLVRPNKVIFNKKHDLCFDETNKNSNF